MTVRFIVYSIMLLLSYIAGAIIHYDESYWVGLTILTILNFIWYWYWIRGRRK